MIDTTIEEVSGQGDEGSLASHSENCGLHPDDQEDLVENSELGNATLFLCK